MSALLVALVLTGAPAGKYALAAAFVRDGRVSLADSKSGLERQLDLGALKANGAALHPRRTQVAVTGSPGGSGPSRLYLKALPAGAWVEAATGLTTQHHAPAFTPDGRHVVFTAAEGEPAGPAHPTKLRAWNVAAKRLEVLPGFEQGGACQFHPSPGPREVHHVETDCFSTFSLRSTSPKVAPLRVSAGDVEVASAPDGSRVLYVERGVSGLAVMLRKGVEEPRLLVMLEPTDEPLQPTFVCPRDVLLVHGGAVKRLNTDTGRVAALADDSKPVEGAR